MAVSQVDSLPIESHLIFVFHKQKSFMIRNRKKGSGPKLLDLEMKLQQFLLWVFLEDIFSKFW